MHNGELVIPQRETGVLQEGGIFAEKPMYTHAHLNTQHKKIKHRTRIK